MQSTPLPNWLFGLYQLLFLLLPWSVEANFGVWALSVPAEPLIGVAGIGLAVVLFWAKKRPEIRLLGGLSVAWILWLLLSACYSGMPLVSWKYALVEAGQWWVFFVGLFCWPHMWPRLFSLFCWSMTGLVFYTIGHHAFYGFRADQALLAPMPFFADHTIYSAVLTLVLPALFPSNLKLQTPNSKLPTSNFKLPTPNFKLPTSNFPSLLGLGIFLLALLLAASRAAWLSLLLAAIFGLVIYYRRHWRWWALAGVLAFFAGVFFQKKITTQLANDVSTQERINRYSCALRMSAERPWTGFGPGTFQFQYLNYQKPEEMTRISRKEPVQKRGPDNYGRGGGAHSEYLQALAELGRPGLGLWLLLVFFSLRTGVQKFLHTNEIYWLLLSLGLLIFFLHGLVNNFLHDARVAALVWGFIAMLDSEKTD